MRLGSEGPALSAVLAYRSPGAFAGVLGSLLAGYGYVPLNPNFPIERSGVMMEQAGCRSLIVDSGSLEGAAYILDQAAPSLLVILPDVEDATRERSRWPRHEFVDRKGLGSPAQCAASRYLFPPMLLRTCYLRRAAHG